MINTTDGNDDAPRVIHPDTPFIIVTFGSFGAVCLIMAGVGMVTGGDRGGINLALALAAIFLVPPTLAHTPAIVRRVWYEIKT